MRVKRLPRTASERVLVRCWKVLDQHVGPGFSSPYMGVTVPNNGLILPRPLRNFLPSNIETGAVLSAGVVHAYRYTHEVKHRSSAESAYNRYMWGPGAVVFAAYAIGVVGYGINTMACKALYVPSADKTPGSQIRRRWCYRRVLGKKMPDQDALVEMFPELSMVL